jgi:PilZ domain
LVDQPSLWPEPFEVRVENVSLGGAYFRSRFLFSAYDFFRCRVVLPGSGSVAGNELRLSAVVVRVEQEEWDEEGHCGVGAFFVGLDPDEEHTISRFVRQQAG